MLFFCSHDWTFKKPLHFLGIKKFLGPNFNRARNLADRFIFHLENLLDWFVHQNHMGFIASSILMAYESDSSFGIKWNDGQEINGYRNSDVLVKLIDFTHVLPISDVDDNCIFAIESLIKYFLRVKTDSNY